MDNRLSQLKDQTAEESKEIAKLEDECDIVKTGLQAANVKQAEIREESAFLKAENCKLKEKISSSCLLGDDLDATKRNHQNQIVSSPDRFRKQISIVESNLADIIIGNKNLEKKSRELQAWIDSIDTAQLWTMKVVHNMNELLKEVDTQKENFVEIDEKRHDADIKRKVLSQIDNSIQQELRKVQRTDEKISQVRKQGAARSKAYSNNISSLHKDLIDCENTCMKFGIKVEHIETDSIIADKEMEAVKFQQEEEKRLMHTSYNRLERIIIDHLQRLYAALDNSSKVPKGSA